MNNARCLIFLVALTASVSVGRPAQAACTDPPRPGVDWQRCYIEERNLNGVRLEGAELRDARFNRSDLGGAHLSGVSAHRAKFISTRLVGASFDAARVTEADFTKADLAGASFVDADMRRARFFRANLKGANLSGARMTGADLLNADLSGATWIDGRTVCSEGSIGQCN
jgi:uncharacterized protein YjbI with pentapeptide repeats